MFLKLRAGQRFSCTDHLSLKSETMNDENKLHHIVLLGDSILDNEKYVPDGLPVIQHLKQIIPPNWQATRVAIDGDETHDVISRTKSIPKSATHLVVSIGGNDAINCLPIFASRVGSIGEALLQLGEMRNKFSEDYRAMLNHVLSFNLPVALCTIYTSVPDLGLGEKTALALFNEIILQEAFLAQLPVIDLRLICNEESDYSEVSPIEPSHAGGQKIARAILSLMQSHDFQLRKCSVIASLDTVC